MKGPHEFHTPQPSYTKEDLLKSGAGELFGPGNAQLPIPPMLMMDHPFWMEQWAKVRQAEADNGAAMCAGAALFVL